MSEKGVSRHFTVSVYIVYDGKVLLVKHRKYNKYLPPGGHVAENELPEETAVRESYEATGLKVKILGEEKYFEQAMQIKQPRNIFLEQVEEHHQHIDMVYFAVPAANNNMNELGDQEWFSPAMLEQHEIPAHVTRLGKNAIEEIAGKNLDL